MLEIQEYFYVTRDISSGSFEKSDFAITLPLNSSAIPNHVIDKCYSFPDKFVKNTDENALEQLKDRLKKLVVFEKILAMLFI